MQVSKLSRKELLGMQVKGNRILFKETKVNENDPDSSIIIPDSSVFSDVNRVSQFGVVTQKGNLRIFDKDINVGDLVYIDRFRGHEFEVDGEFYKLVDERDILAVCSERN